MEKTLKTAGIIIFALFGIWYFSAMLTLGHSLFQGSSKLEIVQSEEHYTPDRISMEGSALDNNSVGYTSAKQANRIHTVTARIHTSAVGTIFSWLFALAATILPVWLFIVCAIHPLKKYKHVNPARLKCALSENVDTRREKDRTALISVATALRYSVQCPDEDKRDLENAIRMPTIAHGVIKRILEKRGEKAEAHAKKVAAMAALSVIVSRSSTLDGIAVMIWKIRLVYGTIKIYGIRPSYGELIKIYGFAAFGAFLSGSLEEMTDLIDLSGGIARINKTAGTIASIVTEPLAMVAQGSLAAYVVLRTFAIVRNALLNGSDAINDKEKRLKANQYAMERCKDVYKDADIGTIVDSIKNNMPSFT